MQTTNTPLVLYVYCCTVCGHSGKLHLPESAPEVTTACSACGAEVQAEWDGGVELTTNQPA
jgi:predicted nucleic acid-binding Zn ribbon protein